MMKTNVLRRVSVVGGCAWLGVAGYGISRVSTDSAEEWTVAYALFNVALLLGVVCTVLLVAVASRQAHRPRLRAAGLVVSGLGCAVGALAAWALPVWMALLGAGFALVVVAGITVAAIVTVTRYAERFDDFQSPSHATA